MAGSLRGLEENPDPISRPKNGSFSSLQFHATTPATTKAAERIPTAQRLLFGWRLHDGTRTSRAFRLRLLSLCTAALNATASVENQCYHNLAASKSGNSLRPMPIDLLNGSLRGCRKMYLLRISA